MTIDEAIRYGAEFQAMNRFSKDASPYEFTSTALDIMFKYKKIEQIISDGYLQGKSSGQMLLEIKGVMNHANKAD